MDKLRIPKFRVWNKTLGKFLCSNCITNYYLTFDGTVFTPSVSSDLEIMEKLEDAIIQQYTSLFDKFDREICEGDIVKLDWDGNKSLAEVVYWKNGFYCQNIHKNILGDTIYLFLYCEIIGNIYENPELLKK